MSDLFGLDWLTWVLTIPIVWTIPILSRKMLRTAAKSLL